MLSIQEFEQIKIAIRGMKFKIKKSTKRMGDITLYEGIIYIQDVVDLLEAYIIPVPSNKKEVER